MWGISKELGRYKRGGEEEVCNGKHGNCVSNDAV